MEPWAKEDNHFGERLRQLREGKKMSQMNLESTSNISQPHINKLEGGDKMPKLRTIEKLADGLNVHPGCFWVDSAKTFGRLYCYEVLPNEKGWFDIRISGQGLDERYENAGSDYHQVEELMLMMATLQVSPLHLADVMNDRILGDLL